MKTTAKINRNTRIGAIARSPTNTKRPFSILIRNLRQDRNDYQWRVLKRVSTQQEAINIVNQHQSDPLNSRQFQYRIA